MSRYRSVAHMISTTKMITSESRRPRLKNAGPETPVLILNDVYQSHETHAFSGKMNARQDV